VHGVRLAILAKLFHFQSSFERLLIFPGKIINRFAFGALQLDHVVLAHVRAN